MMSATERELPAAESADLRRGRGGAWRWLRPGGTDARVWLLLGGLLAACLVYESGPPAHAGLCLVRRVTGLPCPGCGMGHALLAAAKGRLAASWTSHPLGMPALVFAVLVWLRAGARLLLGRPGWLALPRRAARRLALGGLVLVLAVWAVHLLALFGRSALAS